MQISVIHPEATQQPVAATLASEIIKSLPPKAELVHSGKNIPDLAELVIVVFSLKPGAFAPVVPVFRALKNKKVAFVAVITGAVDFTRLRSCSWGIKKQFCGNQVLGGYFCPAVDDVAWGPVEKEVNKVKDFVINLYEEQATLYEEQAAAEETVALVANY